MSVAIRVQAALLGAIVFVGCTQVGVAIGADHNARTAALRAEMRVTMNELMRFVEQAHGGPFLRPVRADLLGDDDFEDALEDDGYADDEGPSEPADWSATMAGLGLTDEDDDLYAAGEAMTDSVVGFYDSDEERLYVRGKTMTPYAKLVLVHELTHAWQDQHYDLDAVQDDALNDDAFAAVHALVEGDASRVETLWRSSQSTSDKTAIGDVEDGYGDEDMSRAEVSLAILNDFPYAAGEKLATAVYERGGNAAIDKAFSHPPTSTEQVLHPAKFFAGETGEKVPAPVTEGNTLDQGVLGELGLLMVVMRGKWDDRAFAAVSGWNGDRYVTWEDDTALCTDATVRMDSAAARDRLVRALEKAKMARDRVTPKGAQGLDLTFCVEA